MFGERLLGIRIRLAYAAAQVISSDPLDYRGMLTPEPHAKTA